MKNIVMIICLIAGYSYGMDCRDESNLLASTSQTKYATYDIKDASKSIKIDVNNPNLRDQWQNIVDVESSGESEDNVFETPSSTYREGRFWTVVRKVFQPMQIAANASTMVLITASEVAKESYPSFATWMSYGALGTTVTAGVLSLFISKMTSKINKLNKTYKAKLAAELNKQADNVA